MGHAIKDRVQLAVIPGHSFPSAGVEHIGLRVVMVKEGCRRLGHRNAAKDGKWRRGSHAGCLKTNDENETQLHEIHKCKCISMLAGHEVSALIINEAYLF